MPRPASGNPAPEAATMAWRELEPCELAELFGASALELGLVTPLRPGSA